ncbi:MAG TPA: amidohydrolase [Hyphomonas atlantica]|uniref:Amidohydrolase n=1 Tax=Hyphomonas atlantica TaxID=1280948 RepID=A0A3B9L087_9PROT|nr:amidohydrolase [Hyphomonas atlantica]
MEANIDHATALIREAAGKGARFIATPEMTNLLDIRPGKARPKIVAESDDKTLAALRALADELGIWLLIGSIAVTVEGEERLANRSFLIAPDGSVRARYDKIHMFDVEVGDGQSYRESRSYRPGERAVLAETEFGKLGMTICYDVRFPHLYRKLAQAGAEILTIPAAFTRVTGEAHWHTLVRARAIETGSFVLAPAQGGKHEDGRETFGHSLIVSPWGDVLAEKADDEPGVIVADIDLDAVAKARARIPSLGNDRKL